MASAGMNAEATSGISRGRAGEHGGTSRSAVIQRAIELLRTNAYSDDYAAAWEERESSDAEAWDTTTADGLGGEAG